MSDTVCNMMGVVVIHVLGHADLGLAPREPVAEAVDRLSTDPDAAVLAIRAAHDGSAGPLLSAVERLCAEGLRVSRLVLVATGQIPAHEYDTASWSVPFARAARSLQVFNLDQSPFEIEILTVREFSIDAFANSVDDVGIETSDRLVLTMAGGPTSAFVGLLCGLLHRGHLPEVLATNNPDYSSRLGPVVHVDLARWLMRRRMWAALSSLPDVSGDIREVAGKFDAFERMQSGVRLPDLPSDRLVQLLARLVSEWATGESVWLPRLTSLVEVLTHRVVKELPETDRRRLEEQLPKWRDLSGMNGATSNVADGVLALAQRHRVTWSQVADCPPKLREWIDRWALPALEEVRDSRHGNQHRSAPGRRGDALHREARDDDRPSHRLLEAVAAGREPQLSRAMRDPMMHMAGRHLAVGRPLTPSPRARMAIQMVGQQNVTASIDAVVERHHAELAAVGGLIGLPVVRIASRDTAVGDDDVIVDIRDVSLAGLDADVGLRARSVELETTRGCRIDRVAVYLNQGTKAMNFAAIRGSITLAAELDATLELFDVARTEDGSTVARPLLAVDIGRLMARTVPERTLRMLLRASVERINLAQARVMARLLGEPALIRDVEQFARYFTHPVAGMRRNDTKGRLCAVAPAVVALFEGRSLIGDADVIARVAPLISAAVSDDGDDGWGRPESTTSRGSRSASSQDERRLFWGARNKVFHARQEGGGRTIADEGLFPEGVTARGLIMSVADHIDVKLDPSEVPWSKAAGLRARILAQLVDA